MPCPTIAGSGVSLSTRPLAGAANLATWAFALLTLLPISRVGASPDSPKAVHSHRSGRRDRVRLVRQRRVQNPNEIVLADGEAYFFSDKAVFPAQATTLEALHAAAPGDSPLHVLLRQQLDLIPQARAQKKLLIGMADDGRLQRYVVASLPRFKRFGINVGDIEGAMITTLAFIPYEDGALQLINAAPAPHQEIYVRRAMATPSGQWPAGETPWEGWTLGQQLIAYLETPDRLLRLSPPLSAFDHRL